MFHQFEMIWAANQHNWIDCSTKQQENGKSASLLIYSLRCANKMSVKIRRFPPSLLFCLLKIRQCAFAVCPLRQKFDRYLWWWNTQGFAENVRSSYLQDKFILLVPLSPAGRSDQIYIRIEFCKEFLPSKI